MVVNVHILYLFYHCVSFALLIIDFIVILHVRLIRVLLKINQSIRFNLSYERDIARRPYLAVILQEWSHVSHKCLEQQRSMQNAFRYDSIIFSLQLYTGQTCLSCVIYTYVDL